MQSPTGCRVERSESCGGGSRRAALQGNPPPAPTVCAAAASLSLALSLSLSPSTQNCTNIVPPTGVRRRGLPRVGRVCGSRAARGRGIPCTLHPERYTLHPAPYTLHPTPYTLHPTPNADHPAPLTLDSKSHTFHAPPLTLDPVS